MGGDEVNAARGSIRRARERVSRVAAQAAADLVKVVTDDLDNIDQSIPPDGGPATPHGAYCDAVIMSKLAPRMVCMAAYLASTGEGRAELAALWPTIADEVDIRAGMPDGVILDPDCRAGKCGSCYGWAGQFACEHHCHNQGVAR